MDIKIRVSGYPNLQNATIVTQYADYMWVRLHGNNDMVTITHKNIAAIKVADRWMYTNGNWSK